MNRSTPYSALWAGVIQQAIADALSASSLPDDRRNRVEAIRWIREGESFEWICDAIDIPADRARVALLGRIRRVWRARARKRKAGAA